VNLKQRVKQHKKSRAINGTIGDISNSNASLDDRVKAREKLSDYKSDINNLNDSTLNFQSQKDTIAIYDFQVVYIILMIK
jgi:hypothetical protein